MTYKVNQPVKIRAMSGSKPYGIVELKVGVFFRLKNNSGLYFKHALLPLEHNNIPVKDKMAILGSVNALHFGVYRRNGGYVYSEDIQVLIANINALEYLETKEDQFIF